MFGLNLNKPAAINEQGESLSYEDIRRTSEVIHNLIPSRSLVFCLCRNSFGALCGYVAFINHRIVPVMLHVKSDNQLLDSLLNRYKPSFLWLPEEQEGDFKAWKRLVSVYDYVLLQNPDSVEHNLYDDLALLLTTSGSTGSPKFTRISYLNLQSNAESIIRYLNINQEERPITSLPMHYSFGLSVINSHLLCGSTILLTTRSIMEKEFWSFLKRENASSLSGVPYTYEMLKRLRFFRMDLPSIRTLTQAGGKLSIELSREFAEYAQVSGKRFFVMYGQTEATARMSYLPAEEALSKPGSIGVSIPGGKFSLVDDNRQIVNSVGETGELVYEGTNVSLGYSESIEDLAKGDENKGVLYTGDLAKQDEEGYYYIVGRKKRFIKLFGNRINLDEAEKLLESITTSECACVGADDKMVIYLTERNRENEIRQYIASKMNININAFEVRYIDSIPKNSSGKTIYSQLSV
jgi:acyl-CoA synthetase (AMP-forming)/AMP-acid ligase II